MHRLRWKCKINLSQTVKSSAHVLESEEPLLMDPPSPPPNTHLLFNLTCSWMFFSLDFVSPPAVGMGKKNKKCLTAIWNANTQWNLKESVNYRYGSAPKETFFKIFL